MTEPSRIPLSDEDRAILDLECATVVGHVLHASMLVGAPVTAAELRGRIAARLPAAPELRYRLTDGPAWIPDTDLDLTRHVVDAPDGPYDDAALRANRLGLLAVLHQAMNRVADLSRLAA